MAASWKEFSKDELRGLLRDSWRWCWRTAAIASLLLLILNIKNATSIDGPLGPKIIACVVVTVMYAVPIALIAGAMRGIWRMVGGWLFLPLVWSR